MLALLLAVVTAPELTVQSAHMRWATHLAVSPDGRLLLTGSGDNDAKLWSLESGRLLRTWLVSGDVEGVAFSPDGEEVAVSTYGQVAFFATRDGAVRRTVKPPEPARAITLTTDFATYAYRTTDREKGNGLVVRAMGDGRELRRYSLGKTGSFLEHSFSPDGRHLLTGSVPVFSLGEWAREGQAPVICPRPSGVAGGAAVSPRGVLACAANGAKVRLLELATNTSREVALPKPSWRLVFDPTGDVLAALDTARGVHFIRANDGRLVRSVELPAPGPARARAYASQPPTGRASTGAFLPGGRAFVVSTDAGALLRLQVERGAPEPLVSPSFDVSTLIGFDRAGKRLLLAKEAEGYVALDLERGRQTSVPFADAALPPHAGRAGIDERKLERLLGDALAAAESPDRARLAVLGPKGELVVVDRRSGRALGTLDVKGVAKDAVAFSPDGRWLGAVGPGLLVFETAGFTEVLRRRSKDEGYHAVAFTPDSKRVIAGGVHGVYAFDAPRFEARIASPPRRAILHPIAIDPAGALVAGVDAFDGRIELFDARTLAWVGGERAHAGKVAAVAFSPDGRWIATSGFDAEIKLWRTKPLALALRIFRDGRDWIAAAPDGRFDGTPDAMKRLHYVDGLETIALEQLFERFFTPRLTGELLTGGPPPAAPPPSLARAVASPPRVEITRPTDGQTLDAEAIEVELAVVDHGKGVAEVRLYHNDKQVLGATRGLAAKSGAALRVPVSLVPGVNVFRAVVLNGERTESAPALATVTLNRPTTQSRLFLLAVGVNAYKNGKYTLGYARPDAESFARTLEKRSRAIFKEQRRLELYDADATKERILGALGQVARDAAPTDVFVFYYAGHGTMSEGLAGGASEFFLAPHDVVRLYGDDPHLAERGLSARELRDAVDAIPARKQLLVLDACQSGGAVDRFALRGAAEERAILQLAKSAGIVVLAATGTEQFASEVKTLGHGVFTYALLQGLEGHADGSPRDGKVTVKELEAYLNDAVPALTEKHRGAAQYPNSFARGQDFPLGTR